MKRVDQGRMKDVWKLYKTANEIRTFKEING